MIVAIDGPAGCGKSTVAKILAEKNGWYYLNTGSIYRAFTLSQINRGGDPLDKDSVLENAKNTKITVENGNICINGVDSESLLHTPEVDKYCSEVSTDPRLRDLVNDISRELTKGRDIITEGRDTTTVIFPNADYKFYFDASPLERAIRRFKEQKGVDLPTVLNAIEKRDKNDKEKAYGALKIADDALYIDTTNLTIEEVCEKVLSTMHRL